MAQSIFYQRALRLKMYDSERKCKILQDNYKFMNLFCYICKQY